MAVETPISAEEEAAVVRSKEWFQHNEGIPFEQVVAELGFSMDQIRASARKDRPLESVPLLFGTTSCPIRVVDVSPLY